MPSAPPLDALHVVARGHGLVADGVQRERGEVVDTTSWRNVQPLINVRQLVPFRGREEDVVTCECGRVWTDLDVASEHRCPERELKRRQPAAKQQRSEA